MKLFDYQLEGAKWLAQQDRALLADEPGLGKTAQFVVAADMINAKQVLYVPPAVGRSVWKNEIEKFSMWGHDVHVFDSVAKFNDGPKRGVNIINYDLLTRGFNEKNFGHNAAMKRWLEPWWDLIGADEAHLLKEPSSLRTRAVLENRGLHGRTDRLWLATGTPMPNHPGELWTILAALGATELSHREFINRYCTVGTHGFSKGQPKGANPETEKELNRLLRTVMKRRLKLLVMPQLPPISVHDTPIPETKIKIEEFFEGALGDRKLTANKIKEQEEFVSEVWSRAIASNGKMDMADMIKILEGVGPTVALYRRWLGAVKAVSFLPILIDELENKAYKKLVIFAHHKQVIQYMKNKLAKYNPVVVDGSISSTKRDKAVNDFQYDDSCRVFIGQTIAAGTAITLTAAQEIVQLEPDWVPANNAQAIMRCHRIGQHLPVRARFVRLADSLDDYISETLTRKTREILRIVDGA